MLSRLVHETVGDGCQVRTPQLSLEYSTCEELSFWGQPTCTLAHPQHTVLSSWLSSELTAVSPIAVTHPTVFQPDQLISIVSQKEGERSDFLLDYIGRWGTRKRFFPSVYLKCARWLGDGWGRSDCLKATTFTVMEYLLPFGLNSY